MSTERRKQEIKRLREEGARARVNLVHRQNCPQQYIGTMDQVRWLEGWDTADRALETEVQGT